MGRGSKRSRSGSRIARLRSPLAWGRGSKHNRRVDGSGDLGSLSLPFIPSALPTTPRFSGTDIKLIWWTLQSTTSIWRIPGCIAVRRSCLAFHARSRCSGSRVPVSSNPNPRTRRRWQPYRTISRCWLAGNGLVSLSVGRRRRRFGDSETARHDRRLSAIRV